MSGKVKFGFRWVIEHVKNGAVVKMVEGDNLITTEGLNYLRNCGILGGDKASVWHILPFEDNHSPVATDTYVTHGYTESTAYSEPARQVFVGNSATDGQTNNTDNKAQFTFNATKTVYGIAFVGGGTSSTGSITALADAGDSTHVTVTSTGHGLSNGDAVTISGTTSYNGTFAVSSVATDTFQIEAAWVADDATGTWTLDPSAQKGHTTSGPTLFSVFNFGAGEEIGLDASDVLKVSGTLTFSDI